MEAVVGTLIPKQMLFRTATNEGLCDRVAVYLWLVRRSGYLLRFNEPTDQRPGWYSGWGGPPT